MKMIGRMLRISILLFFFQTIQSFCSCLGFGFWGWVAVLFFCFGLKRGNRVDRRCIKYWHREQRHTVVYLDKDSRFWWVEFSFMGCIGNNGAPDRAQRAEEDVERRGAKHHKVTVILDKEWRVIMTRENLMSGMWKNWGDLEEAVMLPYLPCRLPGYCLSTCKGL